MKDNACSVCETVFNSGGSFAGGLFLCNTMKYMQASLQYMLDDVLRVRIMS